MSYGDGQALLTQVLSPSLLAHREAQDNYALHTRRRLVCTVSLGAISLGPLRQALSDAGLRDLTVSADGKRLRIDSLPGLPDLVESAAPTTLVGEVDAALSTVRDVATAFEKAARSAGTTAAVQITDAASGDLLQGPRRPSA